ncbi:putative polyvalent protein kinase domain-containing protein [Flavobacterium hauense]
MEGWLKAGVVHFKILFIFTNTKLLKNEIYNIFQGKSTVRFAPTIPTETSYFRNGSSSGATTENTKHLKEQEEQRLEDFISANNLWINDIDLSQYVSEGAEQKVYLKDSDHVLKLNDAIYYSSWKDYLYNLLLHNYFFEDTAYDLLGFTKNEDTLYAIVQQTYVSITELTDLKQVKAFMKSNGFENNRNNDYIHRELGIILEDLHDENVLTKDGFLYFIDTVFYLKDEFWQIDE